MTRTSRFFMRLSYDEMGLLQARAEARGITVSDLVRDAIGLPPVAASEPTDLDAFREMLERAGTKFYIDLRPDNVRLGDGPSEVSRRYGMEPKVEPGRTIRIEVDVDDDREIFFDFDTDGRFLNLGSAGR